MATIVTTLRVNPCHIDPVQSFVSYHLAIGFAHIFIFLDHESNFNLFDFLNDKYGSNSVSVFKNIEDLRSKEREICSTFKTLEQYVDNEVPARQAINAEYAYHIASERGYRWLLHIDIDELFYLSDKSVEEHFDYLDSIGAKSMTYTNHEGKLKW